MLCMVAKKTEGRSLCIQHKNFFLLIFTETQRRFSSASSTVFANQDKVHFGDQGVGWEWGVEVGTHSGKVVNI